LPIFTIALVSYAVKPMFYYRQLIFVVPFFYIGLVSAIFSFPHTFFKRLAAYAFVLYFGYAAQWYCNHQYRKTEIRDSSLYLAKNFSGKDDLVLVSAIGNIHHISYYLDKNHRSDIPVAQLFYVNGRSAAETLAKMAPLANSKRFFFVRSIPGQKEDNAIILELARKWDTVESKTFSDTEIFLFERR